MDILPYSTSPVLYVSRTLRLPYSRGDSCMSTGPRKTVERHVTKNPGANKMTLMDMSLSLSREKTSCLPWFFVCTPRFLSFFQTWCRTPITTHIPSYKAKEAKKRETAFLLLHQNTPNHAFHTQPHFPQRLSTSIGLLRVNGPRKMASSVGRQWREQKESDAQCVLGCTL